MSKITTHVLDVSNGSPAINVPVRLEHLEDTNTWLELGRGRTDSDGRARDLQSSDPILKTGIYRLTFDTASYFNSQNVQGFYPEVTVTFEVTAADQHYHVPLLLSPFGFSTYRGS